MCGIVGYLGLEQAQPILMEGLKRLEYRGYDSAGIATIAQNTLLFCREKGKLVELEKKLEKMKLMGTTGIGHTRWATHGEPSERNAHPQISDQVAIVHNGIIENYLDFKNELLAQGIEFSSDTDTEVIAHMIVQAVQKGLKPLDAVNETLKKLRGAFALAIIFADCPEQIFCAKQGSPLAIGRGEGEMFLGSDAMAFAGLTKKVTYLIDGDRAVLTKEDFEVYDENLEVVSRPEVISQIDADQIGKGEHRHFMHKEIFEQPQALSDTLRHYVDIETQTLNFPDCDLDFDAINRIYIVACGSAYLAGMATKYWLEKFCKIPVEVDLASEFRYGEPPLQKNDLVIFVSQSGETADTLAALRYAKEHEQQVLSVVNVQESTIARESAVILPTLSGPEIGVASTKAFTAQILVLTSFALFLAEKRKTLEAKEIKSSIVDLIKLPGLVSNFLLFDEDIQSLAEHIMEKTNALFIGRGTSKSIAYEGALKLKELSYIHAEAYAAGELKHGPIALVDKTMPIIALIPNDIWTEKTISNVEEILARHGDVVLMGCDMAINHFGDKLSCFLRLPDVPLILSQILYTIPIQLLAYHTAVQKGTDVDQPRNLAKSVTVE